MHKILYKSNIYILLILVYLCYYKKCKILKNQNVNIFHITNVSDLKHKIDSNIYGVQESSSSRDIQTDGMPIINIEVFYWK